MICLTPASTHRHTDVRTWDLHVNRPLHLLLSKSGPNTVAGQKIAAAVYFVLLLLRQRPQPCTIQNVSSERALSAAQLYGKT